MDFISASKLIPDLPEELPAVLLFDRLAHGRTVRICAVGDISFSGNVRESWRTNKKNGFSRAVMGVFQSSEIIFGNLECVLGNDISPDSMFAAPTEAIEILRTAGFSILHLANNHIYDFGPKGLGSTLCALEKAGIQALGAGWSAEEAKQIRRTDRSGIRIGWLGCGWTRVRQNAAGPAFWEFNEDDLYAAVRRIRAEVDVLVLSIHKGLMYLDYPAPADRAFMKRLAAAGANVILMHHSHVLQGVEIFHEHQFCCYSLGNFLFDSSEGYVVARVMEIEQNSSAVFLLDIDVSGLVRAFAIPTEIVDHRDVRWASGENGMRVLTRLRDISRQLEDDYTFHFVKQRFQRNVCHFLRALTYHLLRGNFRLIASLVNWNTFKQTFQLLRIAVKNSGHYLCRKSWLK